MFRKANKICNFFQSVFMAEGFCGRILKGVIDLNGACFRFKLSSILCCDIHQNDI